MNGAAITPGQAASLGDRLSRLKARTVAAVRRERKFVLSEDVHEFVDAALMKVYPGPSIAGYAGAMEWIDTKGRADRLAEEFLRA